MIRRYKILKKSHDGTLYSCVLGQRPAGVKYRYDKWVKTHRFLRKLGYHPLVFNTVDDALRFAMNYGYAHHGVYAVEVSGPKPLLSQRVIDSLNQALVEKNASWLEDYDSIQLGWPQGSQMWRKVKVLELIGIARTMRQEKGGLNGLCF